MKLFFFNKILFKKTIYRLKLAGCVCLCLLPAKALYAQSDDNFYDYFLSRPLDIEAISEYARLKIDLRVTAKHVSALKVVNVLKKYLLFSGVFDTEIPPARADLILTISDSVFFGLSADFSLPRSGEVLYEGLIKLSPKSRIIEQNVIEFIDGAIMAIDGQKSMFGSAILYSESKKGGASNIVLTDFLGTKRYSLVADGNINILPVWSHDGTKFLYTSIGVTGARVYIWDFKEFKLSKLANVSGSTTGGVFIPGDKKVILTQSVAGRPSLYLHDLVAGSWEKLIFNPYIATSGQLHGGRLLFTSNRSRGVQIFLKPHYLEDGREYRMTFLGNNNSEPRWSSKGDVFSYTSFYRGFFQIFLMSDDGNSLRQLTTRRHNAEQGVWSADDRQIIYTAFVPGKSRLRFITLDGKFGRDLTQSQSRAAESDPAWSNNFDWGFLTKFAK